MKGIKIKKTRNKRIKKWAVSFLFCAALITENSAVYPVWAAQEVSSETDIEWEQPEIQEEAANTAALSLEQPEFTDSETTTVPPDAPASPESTPTEPTEPTPAEPTPEEPIPTEPAPTGPIPTQPAEQPGGSLKDRISISRKKMENGVKPGEKFSVALLLRNGDPQIQLKNAKVNLALPTGVSMDASQKVATIQVGTIQCQEEKKVEVALIAGEECAKQDVLNIPVTLTYEYGEGEKGNAQETILVPVSVEGNPVKDTLYEESGGGESWGGGSDSGSTVSEKKTIDPLTPNVIISHYEYDKNVKAGDTFTVKLVLFNTSKKTAIENMVMSLEPGEALSIEDSSNSSYIEQMNPQGSVGKEIRLKALSDGKPENSKIDISFKYEYLKNEERTQATSTEKLAIPVTQPDRFDVGEIQKQMEITVGEETTLSVPYVNKGKGTIYNLEAQITTDMGCEETTKYMGNVEPGTNGTIDFFVTPQQEGEQKVQVLVSYENGEGTEKSADKEAALTANMGQEETMGAYEDGQDMMGMEEESEPSFFEKNKLFLALFAGVVLVLTVFGIRRHKRKKRLLQEESL